MKGAKEHCFIEIYVVFCLDNHFKQDFFAANCSGLSTVTGVEAPNAVVS